MKFAKFAPVAAVGAALAVVLGLFSASGAGNNADSFAIDLDTSGNTATVLGTREECLEVSAGDTVTFDVTATNIPAATAMIAFAHAIIYDSGAITVTAADVNFLLGSAAGSSAAAFGDETILPDTDGNFVGTGVDSGPTDPPPGSAESGSGVLERITIQIDNQAAAGGYTLTLDPQQTAHVGITGLTYPPDAVLGARLAVGVTCASIGTPTPPPTFLQGDVDCNGSVVAVDSLKILRFVAGLSVAQGPGCPLIGSGSVGTQHGNVDCSVTGNPVGATDALKVLRFVAGLSVTQTEPPPCKDIGT